MAALIQIVAPHPTQTDGAQRKLFILVCPWDTCSDRGNGWRVIRQVKKLEEAKAKAKTVATTNWGDEDDEWGLSETVEKMTISESEKRIDTVVTSLGTGHYINVVEDYHADDLSHENELLRKYEQNEAKWTRAKVAVVAASSLALKMTRMTSDPRRNS